MKPVAKSKTTAAKPAVKPTAKPAAKAKAVAKAIVKPSSQLPSKTTPLPT